MNNKAIKNIFHSFSSLTFRIQGITWMLIWSICMSIAMSMTKALEPETNGFMLVFLRCIFGTLFIFPFIFASKKEIFTTKKHKIHLLRVGFYCTAIGCTYYAYRNLPLAEASAIGLTGPLMTTLLARIILNDQVSWKKWFVVILGYIGVLIVINPKGLIINYAMYILLLANFAASVTSICTKILSKTESTALILSYTSIASVIFTANIALQNWVIPSIKDIFIILGAGLFGICSQYAYTKALTVESPSFLSPFEFTRLIFAVPIGVFVFGEEFSINIIIGGSIIGLAIYLLTRIRDT